MSTYTPASPATAALPDSRGAIWQFAYWGSGYIYIREMFVDENRVIPVGDRVSRDDWPFLIDLNVEGMRPEDVTREWLAERAGVWIDARNTDIASGDVD
jgi:hypothetical protein